MIYFLILNNMITAEINEARNYYVIKKNQSIIAWWHFPANSSEEEKDAYVLKRLNENK